MKIPPEKLKAAVSKLQAKATLPTGCPTCGAREFDLNEEVFQSAPFAKGALVVGGTVFPFVILICKNCGNSMAFSAVLLGIIDPKTGELTLD
ncbi:MAG: hypothetical protein WBG19_10270 [Thermoplasmata archaeon]